MAISTNVETEKITVSLPKELVERLRNSVSLRQRSAFIADAVADKLALLEQVEAIDESAGAWKNENHPEFQTDEGIDRWIAELRGTWNSHQTEELNDGTRKIPA